jgi:signal transduction histidine kinase
MHALQAQVSARLPRAEELATALVAAVLYYGAVKLGFLLTPADLAISLLWPANALLLAVLLLTPTERWWIVIAAVVPAHLAAELQGGVPPVMVAAWLVSNCAEALLGAGAIRTLQPRGIRFFDSFRGASLLLACAFIAPIVSSFIDAAFVQLIGWGEEREYWRLVQVRAASNTVAALTVLPFVLSWAAGLRNAGRVSMRLYGEALFVFAGLAAASLFVFRYVDPALETPALFYAPLPFMLWAAVRLGPVGVTTANLVLAGIAISSAVNGLGPFTAGSVEEDARSVQYFLVAATVPLLLLAVLLEERRRVETETRDQRHQLTHLARVATLGGLSGALAHELNQPLTAILSNAQAAQQMLAARRLDVAEFGEILSDIVSADRRASQVIGRLRALFRDGESRLVPLDVNEVVREVLDLAHGDLVMHHVTVVTNLDPRSLTVSSDRVQLQQVLLNLVMNACEAMEGEAANVRLLSVATAPGTLGSVRITVSDRGRGLPEVDAERLFQPFYTTKPQGLGLGLSISRSIVAAQGGRLWGEALPGRGAAFHVELPTPRLVPAMRQTLVQ